MTTITPMRSTSSTHKRSSARAKRSLVNQLRSFKPRPVHASIIISSIVALKSFEMSFAALHDLSMRNLVAPDLAANVPIAIDGLVVGSIVATASFRKGGVGWWYATGLFVLSTLVSVAGNIEYALEIGGDAVSVAVYAGMPLTMLFAVHLTLMLWQRGRAARSTGPSATVPEPAAAVTTPLTRAVQQESAPELAPKAAQPTAALTAGWSAQPRIGSPPAANGLNGMARTNAFEAAANSEELASTGGRV